ncbi:cytosol aminopeptidase-like [Python bivittatus]|uniref:Cytosol aminopeptidase-like n=1 Tax=Python bivittatus TaxID=176946 RepID=A0A9F2RDI7_PYTBI|nr:cytosol aminopeptidase-like [Python bivittatus]
MSELDLPFHECEVLQFCFVCHYKETPQQYFVAKLSAFLFSDGTDGWEKGIRYAEGQNLARYLMEGPASHITPTKFATIIEDKLKSFSNVTVHKRDKSWIQAQGMGSFWSVAKGSDEPPVFLEVHYQGSSNPKEAPLVFVGKGITFDR